MVQVKERNFQDFKSKYDSLVTDLNKMEYLESALKLSDCPIDVKKFAFANLAELYNRRLMYDKAAKAMAAKAGYDITFREKIDSYLKAAEYYGRSGNILAADDMFLRATREANTDQRPKILLARKNIYMSIASEQEKRARMAHAVKFYEHLLTIKLDDLEKSLVKKKLVDYYKRVGKFNEAKIVENK